MRDPRWLPWARWAGLGLLGLFTLTPLYVMLTSAIKPLQDVQGDFH